MRAKPVPVPVNEQYRLIMECRASGMADYQWCVEHDCSNREARIAFLSHRCSPLQKLPSKFLIERKVFIFPSPFVGQYIGCI